MKTKIIFLITLLISFISFAQSIEKSSIDSGGASATAGNIEILYTIGEVVVQEASVGDIILSEGFIGKMEITINRKVFLQGAYDSGTGLMSDNLRVNGLIPLTSPYTDELVVEQSILNITGDDDIVVA